MKHFVLFTIGAYQLLISPILKTIVGSKQSCRFSPSCSEYTRRVILQFGIVRGLFFGARRILSCNPLVG